MILRIPRCVVWWLFVTALVGSAWIFWAENSNLCPHRPTDRCLIQNHWAVCVRAIEDQSYVYRFLADKHVRVGFRRI